MAIGQLLDYRRFIEESAVQCAVLVPEGERGAQPRAIRLLTKNKPILFERGNRGSSGHGRVVCKMIARGLDALSYTPEHDLAPQSERHQIQHRPHRSAHRLRHVSHRLGGLQ